MPTSSQALTWLKGMTEFSHASLSDRLPDVFRYRYEDSTAAETSPTDRQHQIDEISLLTSRQGTPGRLYESDQLSNCVPLPPIDSSSRQPSSSTIYNPREPLIETQDGNQLPTIDTRSAEIINKGCDAKTESNSSNDNELPTEWNIDRRKNKHKILGENEFENVMDSNINTINDVHSEKHKQIEAESVRDKNNDDLIDDNFEAPISESIDLSFDGKNSQNSGSSEDEDFDEYKPGCTFNKPNTSNEIDYLVEEGTPQEPGLDIQSKKPLLTCVLNLQLRNQHRTIREDTTSCVGILSYNHNIGRHVWNLVPQKIRSPRRVIRGRYITKITPGEKKMEVANFRQMKNENFLFRTFHQKHAVRADNGIDSEYFRVSKNGIRGMTQVSYAPPVSVGSPNQDKADINCANNEDSNIYACVSEHAINGELDQVHSNRKLEEVSPMNPVNEAPSRRQRNPYDNLRCSGIIENESYFFDEGDNLDKPPRFLETLSTAPKPLGKALEYKSDLPWSTNLPHEFPYFAMNYSHNGIDRRCETTHRTFTGLTLTQKEKARSKTRKNSSVPRVDTETNNEQATEIPPVTVKVPTHVSPENEENKSVSTEERINEPENILPLTEPKICAPTEAKVILMRSELPPPHPSRLCFRTSLSGCSHAEVMTEIESQKNVKVIWLQYEPVSLHYTDVVNADYRHVCMWLFELSPDSDPTNLLLEGIKLRGQRVNVLHLDDVYMEEYRTFNLCNEVYLEQRSKNLLKNKSRHILKSARII